MSTAPPRLKIAQPETAPEASPVEVRDEQSLRGSLRSASSWTRRRILIAIAAAWVLSGTYLVAPDQQAVETLFGKVVVPRAMPGLHYALPWPVERVIKLKVRQQQRLVVGGDLPDGVLGRTQPLASQFLTGDQNIINARVVVQYSVSVPSDYLF